MARLATRANTGFPDVTARAAERILDDGQARAAAAIASTDPLVVVEGAAGAGTTTMLAVAIPPAVRGTPQRADTPMSVRGIKR